LNYFCGRRMCPLLVWRCSCRARARVSAASWAVARARARAPAAGAFCLYLWCFLRLLLPCSCSCIRCFMGGCTCSCSGTGCGCFLPLFVVFFAAVAAVLVLVHPLLHGRLHVLVLGHRPPVFLRSFKVRFCGWCFCARAAVSNASGAAAGALTRASCVVPCAAMFP